MLDFATETIDRMPRVPGRCRRCGWGAPLMKVGKRGRALLGVGRSLRLLCDDCVADLVGTAHRDLVQMAGGRHPSDRDRPEATSEPTVQPDVSTEERDRELISV